MEISPEIRARREQWVRDLRSNSFRQCRGAMYKEKGFATGLPRHADSFCCLGVGARQFGEDHVYDYFSRLGLSDADSAVLVKMNDKEDKTFAEIADWIEENLL